MSVSGIKDKVIVITGASSGIGEATAMLLAERGARVVLGARRLDQLEAIASRIEKSGGKAAYLAADVKRSEDLSNLVQLACEKFGKLDVLVNNVGVMPMSPFDDLRVEEWEDMIDINIKGVLYGIAAGPNSKLIRISAYPPTLSLALLRSQLSNQIMWTSVK
ncbi:SDR family oxidoreductase [Paenibacillus sinensis]|uniref:SDR family oxidoreductase n=1 Tax=Paenibacillus TaxID=44249 RepID=UPI00389917C6